MKNIVYFISFLMGVLICIVLLVQATNFEEKNHMLKTNDNYNYSDTVYNTNSFLKSFSSRYFSPNPTKSVIYSAILPGLGQFYNRKYWKLPIIYAGFCGCIYVTIYNNNQYNYCNSVYRTFSNGNFFKNCEIHQFDKNDNNYLKWREKNYLFIERLKNKKDFYRRNRDLGYIAIVGWYTLFIIDAYVDAQLFNFDIGEDLSLKVNLF